MKEYDVNPVIVDPWANPDDAMKEYGLILTDLEEVKDVDCVIIAVAHQVFRKLDLNDIKKLYKNCADADKVLLDVKGIYNISDLEQSGMRYWRL